VTEFAFISYSHFDGGAYVEGLAAHLTKAGITVWYDKELITGDRWTRVIQTKIEESSAMIVVMTAVGADSKWIAREIAEAERLNRSILPLLVTGKPYFELGDTHYENVTAGQMPSDAFVARLAQLTAPRIIRIDPAVVGLQRRHERALHVGESGRYAAAVRLCRELVDDRVPFLGADHPDTLASRHQLGRFIGNAGDYAEAIRLYRELVDDRVRVLGADHPDTLASRNNLAWFIGNGGDYGEAIRLYRELVDDRVRVLGADHPDTLASRNNLAWFIGNGGDYAEAIRLYRKLIPDQVRVLGADHPDTLASRHNLASFIGSTGDYAEAVRLYRELIPDRVRVLGADHPGTLACRHNLAIFEARLR